MLSSFFRIYFDHYFIRGQGGNTEWQVLFELTISAYFIIRIILRDLNKILRDLNTILRDLNIFLEIWIILTSFYFYFCPWIHVNIIFQCVFLNKILLILIKYIYLGNIRKWKVKGGIIQHNFLLKVRKLKRQDLLPKYIK